MALSEGRHQICTAVSAVATLLWITSTVSGAEFGLRIPHNYTQGIKFREERNAVWDAPFHGAIYVPELPSARESYSLQRGDRNVEEFHSLCEAVSRRVELSDTEYEYRPPYYHEKICRTYGESERADAGNQMCMFSCIQRMDIVYLTRRRYDTNCWETFTKTVASSCDCMWPETKYAPTG